MKKLVVSSILAAVLLSGAGFAKTFAKVNGKDITEADIATLMRAMPGGVAYEQLPEEVQKQVIQQAIERKLLIEKAKKDGTQNSKEFKNALEDLQEDLVLEIWMRQQMQKVSVSAAEISKFYNDNKTRFVQPEAVCASHILVEKEADAKSIIADLKKAGSNLATKFADTAKAKSKDGTARNGGDLGCFSKDQMVPEFGEAAFKMKKGDLSQSPVKSAFGYHVVLVKDKQASRTLSENEVKSQIEQNLKIRKFQENVKKQGEDLKKGAKIDLMN